MNSDMHGWQLPIKLSSHPLRWDLQTTPEHCRLNWKMTLHAHLEKDLFDLPLSDGWKKDP